MDNEIKDILMKLMEGQTRLEEEVSSLKDEVSGVKNDMNENSARFEKEIGGLKSEVGGLKGEVSSLKGEVGGLKNEVHKNSVKIEEMDNNIKIIAEVQSAHKEQSENSFKDMNRLIEEKTGLIEAAVKSVSKDVNETKDSVEVIKEMTGKHEVDINILKRRPV